MLAACTSSLTTLLANLSFQSVHGTPRRAVLCRAVPRRTAPHRTAPRRVASRVSELMMH